MFIKKNQATTESFAKGIVQDYPMPNDDLGISYQEQSGRVPVKGWGINDVCHEIYYVISGTAEVYIDNEHKTIQEGDIVILLPGQKSYLIANQLKLLTITQPNWYAGQYRQIIK